MSVLYHGKYSISCYKKRDTELLNYFHNSVKKKVEYIYSDKNSLEQIL